MLAQEVVVQALSKYFLARDQSATVHPLLDAIWHDEYAYRQALGGIETSLGTQLWERLSRRLAVANGFELLAEKTALRRPQRVDPAIEIIVNNFERDRNEETGGIPISHLVTNLEYATADMTPTKTAAALTKGDGIDLYFRRDDVDYAFDIKTVQFNAGDGRTFNKKLMWWYAYFYLLPRVERGAQLNAKIVIPYDPCIDSDWWTMFGSRASPLDRSDVLIGAEYWELVTGNADAWSSISDAFEELATSSRLDTIRRNLVNRSLGVKDRVLLIESAWKLELGNSLDELVLEMDDSPRNRQKHPWLCTICCSGEVLEGTISQASRGAVVCGCGERY